MKAKLLKSGLFVVDLKELNEQNSNGNLKKWVGFVGNRNIYIKSFSSTSCQANYECESECVASRLAYMLGISNVCIYYLDKLQIDNKIYKVCFSYDFVEDGIFKSYKALIRGVSKYSGKDKYNLVLNCIPYFRSQIDAILVFDSIIGNDDRHLRNLGVLKNSSGTYIPLFDNGNSLFYNKSDTYISHILKTSLDFLPCKPFYSTYGNQVKLCDLSKVSLNKVKKEDVYKLVNSYYTGERAKLLCKFLILRLRRYNLLWN